MEVISIFEAKNKLSKLISDVENRDTSYLICRNGKPVAEIVAHKAKNRLKGSPELHIGIKGELFDDDMSGDFECLQ
ncbi:MAG: type II toxin-antitoxin system Phd/YefM family antitoxin [Proteobacteria bacterium]|nr:type II toxin-antitoxin system Phd/YefM family antitoxin [Pseudomonadota bacterium]MBU1697554.1 type II toxin-antitoxin system Phd/YefM family antitoxin [Pseudomonadota bacterium]